MANSTNSDQTNPTIDKDHHNKNDVAFPKAVIPIQRCSTLYINPSTPKGRGVFTSAPIPSGTIIDTCAALVLSPQENTAHIEHTELYHYTYTWPLVQEPPPSSSKKKTSTQAVVFGLGSLFNHSSAHQNVGWKRDLEREVVRYFALRDIQEGEELCISYGDRLTFEDADAPTPSAVDGDEDEGEVLGRIQLET